MSKIRQVIGNSCPRCKGSLVTDPKHETYRRCSECGFAEYCDNEVPQVTYWDPQGTAHWGTGSISLCGKRMDLPDWAWTSQQLERYDQRLCSRCSQILDEHPNIVQEATRLDQKVESMLDEIRKTLGGDK